MSPRRGSSFVKRGAAKTKRAFNSIRSVKQPRR